MSGNQIEWFARLSDAGYLCQCCHGWRNAWATICWYLKINPKYWCTHKFKIKPLMQYFKPPAYSMLGIDAGEAHRAKIVSEKGIENRYPLVEAGISRDGCKEIIRAHGLPVPQKSGCFICPYQRQGQWKRLRAKHPDLFCRAEQLEKNET
jgi:hypothetical protein